METFRVEIINPKAKKLLKALADMNLISYTKTIDAKEGLEELLSRLRSKAEAPSLEEITREVESVRASRHAKKAK